MSDSSQLKKLNFQKAKIMASGPINSCKLMGKQWKLTLFFALHEIKRRLSLEEK